MTARPDAACPQRTSFSAASPSSRCSSPNARHPRRVHRVYDVTEFARGDYAQIGTVPWLSGKAADACTECGECEEKCPQNIPIREQLKETARALGRQESTPADEANPVTL